MINDAALRPDAAVVAKNLQGQARAFALVLQVRGVDENELVVPRGEIYVLFEDFQFVPRVFVEADFADAQHIRAVKELRDQRENFAGESEVFGLLGIDAKPAIVSEAELGGTLRFVAGELAKVIVKASGGTAVETGPEGWFAHGQAAGGDHGAVIIRYPADHVGVGLDVAHRRD